MKRLALGLVMVMAFVDQVDGAGIVDWGSDSTVHISYAPTPIGTDFIAIAAGQNHNLALRSNGSLVSWGGDWWGQVSDTPEDNDIFAIACSAENCHFFMKRFDSMDVWLRNTCFLFEMPKIPTNRPTALVRQRASPIAYNNIVGPVHEYASANISEYLDDRSLTNSHNLLGC